MKEWGEERDGGSDGGRTEGRRDGRGREEKRGVMVG
jgi:hypothetical protein